MNKQILVIARKEVVDHFRETRSLLASLMHLWLGPAIVLLMAFSPAVRGNSRGATVLTAMMAIFTLVAAFTGGMNIAMDVVAGERERHSLLPLLLTPVSRAGVVLGKWLGVCAFSLSGLAVTLFGFFISERFLGVANPLFDRPALLRWVLLGLVPLAFFAAAVQVGISTATRTAKEAHTYLSLLIFLPMGVAMFLVFFVKDPGFWAFLPVAGQQAIVQTGLSTGHWSISQALVLAVMTVWCTAATLALTSKLLERDDIV